MSYAKTFLVAAALVVTPLALAAAPAAPPHPVSAPAKKAAPAPKLPTLAAADVAERSAAARGGAAAWAKVNALSFAGRLDAGIQRPDGGPYATAATNPRQARLDARAAALAAVKGASKKSEAKIIQLPYRAEFARPMKQRIEVDFKDQTAVQVYDGTHGWKLRPFLGRHEVEDYSPQELQIAASQDELDGPLLAYKAKGWKLESDGTETVDGKDCYRLKLIETSGLVRQIWIDAKTFLEVRVEAAPRHVNGKMRRVFTTLGDYRAEQGLMVPHVYTTQVESIPQAERIFVDKVAVNPPLEPSRFTKPL